MMLVRMHNGAEFEARDKYAPRFGEAYRKAPSGRTREKKVPRIAQWLCLLHLVCVCVCVLIPSQLPRWAGDIEHLPRKTAAATVAQK